MDQTWLSSKFPEDGDLKKKLIKSIPRDNYNFTKNLRNTTVAQNDPYPFEDFAPTLSQCFILVIVGYLLAKFELLTSSDVKGVISFATYFAMPGIICLSLADADFCDFRWELIFGIFLGKCLTFVVVAGFLMLLNCNVGVAGSVALFSVQSNDLPVGNPLMSSLYKNYRPHMMKYLFLIPAMTVIFFVPIYNVMLSVYREKRRRINESKESAYRDCLKYYFYQKEFVNEIYGIVKNPVVIATMLGIFLNFLFQGSIPKVLHKPIQVAAATIPGIALAMLGFSFVRKERYLLTSAVVPAMVLIILKMALTPVLLHTILRGLTKASKSSQLLSDFALLYGIISPATTVFHSGQEFRKSLAVMSVALILTSFSCFPVSYVVARLTIAPIHNISLYVPLLKHILFWTACVSIVCDVFTWFNLMRKQKRRQVSSSYIMCLLFTQITTCCGVLLWSNVETGAWMVYLEMALNFGGEIFGYFWSCVLALVLVYSEKYSMLAENCFTIITFTAFSVSALITAVMCILITYSDFQSVYVVGQTQSNFEFWQLIMTSFLLLVNLVVVAFCLFSHFKQRKLPSEVISDHGYENSVFYIEEQDEKVKTLKQKETTCAEKTQVNLEENVEALIYYEEFVSKNTSESKSSPGGKEWAFRLSSLLILMELTMLVRFTSNMYKIIQSQSLEVMIPIEFLQSVLFVGQGIFILLTFGVDIRTYVICLKKWWRRMRHGADETVINSKNMEEVTPFCKQFYIFYYDRCFRAIATNRRWKGAIYKESFWGHQLVDWLISEGLCQDDTDAEGQGQKLLAGGIIQHVSKQHHFYNAPYLYHFVKKN